MLLGISARGFGQLEGLFRVMRLKVNARIENTFLGRALVTE